jgi:hypothetical protein
MTYYRQDEQRDFWKWCMSLSGKSVFRRLVSGRMLERTSLVEGCVNKTQEKKGPDHIFCLSVMCRRPGSPNRRMRGLHRPHLLTTSF